MKELLNVIVADDTFQDNARPGFLVNPLTTERLEFDRWYPTAGVAIEFNGPQHYRATEDFPDLDQVRQQQARDLMKAALANEHNISLITVQPPELTIAILIEKVSGLLPIRELRFEDPVVRYLHRSSQGYVGKVG